jgi:acyl carrier protein
MEELERTIDEVLREVARDRSLVGVDFAPDRRLVDDVGFKSLDLARIVAHLEHRLGLDPFSRLVPITRVRTVGDLQAAYRQARDAGDAEGGAERDAVLDAARVRGAGRGSRAPRHG